MQAADDLPTQGAQVIAMQAQGLASAPETQQVSQEGLKDDQQSLPGWQIAGLDLPAVRPVIEVQIVIRERLL
jgi:hypothetical protein